MDAYVMYFKVHIFITLIIHEQMFYRLYWDHSFFMLHNNAFIVVLGNKDPFHIDSCAISHISTWKINIKI